MEGAKRPKNKSLLREPLGAWLRCLSKTKFRDKRILYIDFEQLLFVIIINFIHHLAAQKKEPHMM